MATYDPNLTPQLRPVEAVPLEENGRMTFLLRDPTQLATSAITVSEAALYVLSKFDGHHTLSQVRDSFAEQFGQMIDESVLVDMVAGLQSARLLAGDEFDRFYQGLVDDYLAAPTRPMESAAELGLDRDTASTIQAMIDLEPSEPVSGRIVGVVAPHLDYPRGGPCYSAAYSLLVNRPAPARVVVLGTNHFGQSASVVATAKDFETPLGVTRTDVAFLETLEAKCGPLREHEFDHRREHSVELQVLICQHIWRPDSFRIVPLICPDPCGPTGTRPYDGEGVDLRDFAEALRAAIDQDPDDTLVIAGADLSHVGAQFGDAEALDDGFLSSVRQRDMAALECVADNDADAFLRQVTLDENPTRVCSAGCIYATMRALPRSKARVLRYHQAIVPEAQTGVTCAAVVFVD